MSNEVEGIIRGINLKKDEEEILRESEKLGQYFAKDKKMKMNQLRKFFDEVLKNKDELQSANVQNVEERIKASLYRMKALLAYAKGRDVISRDFYSLMETCIQQIIKSENKEELRKLYERFYLLLEGTVAFYTYYKR